MNRANDKDKDLLLPLAMQLRHQPLYVCLPYMNLPCSMQKHSTGLSFSEFAAQVQPEEEPGAQGEESNTDQPQAPGD